MSLACCDSDKGDYRAASDASADARCDAERWRTAEYGRGLRRAGGAAADAAPREEPRADPQTLPSAPKPAAMPSHSSLTSSEKSLVKKHAPTSQGDKIHAAAIGRVYYAFPDPTKWSYSGISGAVVFGWGQAGGWLKVVDLAVSGARATRPAE